MFPKSKMSPGASLRYSLLNERNIPAYEVSALLRLPEAQVQRIFNNEEVIDAALAQHLASVVDGTPEFWLNAQRNYELALVEKAEKEGENDGSTAQHKVIHLLKRAFVC